MRRSRRVCIPHGCRSPEVCSPLTEQVRVRPRLEFNVRDRTSGSASIAGAARARRPGGYGSERCSKRREGKECFCACFHPNSEQPVRKVFIGGSRRLGRLDPQVKSRPENMIAEGLQILVGDANGADKAIQEFFSERGYDNFVVFYAADCMPQRPRSLRLQKPSPLLAALDVNPLNGTCPQASTEARIATGSRSG